MFCEEFISSKHFCVTKQHKKNISCDDNLALHCMSIYFLFSKLKVLAILMDSLAMNNKAGNNQESSNKYSSLNIPSEYLFEVSCPTPSLSSVSGNKSAVKLSPQDATTKISSKKTLQNIGQDGVSLLHPHVNQDDVLQPHSNVNQNDMFHPNVNQETLTHCVDSRLASLATKSKEEEDENDGDILPDTISRTSHKKAGVILLGRGNSFSLGRSEVMLVHANRRRGTSLKKDDNCYQQSSMEDNIRNNNTTNTKSCNKRNLNDSDNAGPNYDNRTSGNVVNQKAQELALLPRELETLWQKAERVMAAKETVVQHILEEFGIGDAGSSVDETEEKVMEENIWQAMQDNFHI